MINKKLYIKLKNTLACLVALLLLGCVEEVSFETDALENALVVEATITNENKYQEIRLSRTYRFEDNGPTAETGASVSIQRDGGTIGFQETSEPGVYRSSTAFAAQSNSSYQLLITTNDGIDYMSSPTQMATEVAIDELYAERGESDLGVNGMFIYVDSFDPTGQANYFRYEYEETYKIVAPLWNTTSMIEIEDPPCTVELGTREQEERVCYNTVLSTDVNLANTSGLSESRVQRHLIRFMDSDNYIISHRYSILVRQYVQSQEAYTYFKLLSDLSESESLLSQNQPGFFDGNVRSENNSDEKVVGFFEVSSVSEKRLYFNYEDFYPNESLPPYPSGCTEMAPESGIAALPEACNLLVVAVRNNEIRFVRINDNPNDIFPGPYIVVARACGDCTALGSNIEPDFWVD